MSCIAYISLLLECRPGLLSYRMVGSAFEKDLQSCDFSIWEHVVLQIRERINRDMYAYMCAHDVMEIVRE